MIRGQGAEWPLPGREAIILASVRTRQARAAVTKSTPNTVRVLHVTDPHLFADPAASLRGTVTHDSLRSVLEHIRAADWPADLVAMTGDLIQDDSAGAYVRFRDLLSTLGLPVHCVPGNHDVRKLMKEALSMPPFYYCGVYVRRDWTIIGIDSCMHGSAAGRIDDREFARLETAVGDARTPHVLICLHHPPRRMGSRWLDQVGLEDSERFLETLSASRKVRGCLFGHAHQPFDERYDSLSIIGTPSTCRQFRPHSDTFTLDDRPPAYRRVELLADGGIRTDLVWLPQPDAS